VVWRPSAICLAEVGEKRVLGDEKEWVSSLKHIGKSSKGEAKIRDSPGNAIFFMWAYRENFLKEKGQRDSNMGKIEEKSFLNLGRLGGRIKLTFIFVEKISGGSADGVQILEQGEDN